MNSASVRSLNDLSKTLHGNVESIIKCFICLDTIKKPLMCPLCQKLMCEECITKYLNDKKKQCPHCHIPLKLNQLIQVSFMSDLVNYIDKIGMNNNKEKNEICKKHQIEFLYYCDTCKIPLCSDCFMLEEDHKSHTIKKISEVYNDHLKLIKLSKETLETESKNLENNLKIITDKIVEIGNNKYQKIKETEELCRNIEKKIQNNSQFIISKYLNLKKKTEEKISELDSYLKKINNTIINSSKNELVYNSNNLIQKINDIKSKVKIEQKELDILPNNIALEINNPLLPKYSCGSFEIKNFLDIKINKIIYSNSMRINGLSWKIKVYPKGNESSKGEYISVFLELESGVNESSKYYYVIELVNFQDKANFRQEYSSNFINGECWGYSKFYKINKIKEDGFINDSDGKINIKVYIRPESFEQLTRDLNNYISLLENKNNIKKGENSDKEIEGEEEEEDENNIDNRASSMDNSLKNLNFANEFLINAKEIAEFHTEKQIRLKSLLIKSNLKNKIGNNNLMNNSEENNVIINDINKKNGSQIKLKNNNKIVTSTKIVENKLNDYNFIYGDNEENEFNKKNDESAIPLEKENNSLLSDDSFRFFVDGLKKEEENKKKFKNIEENFDVFKNNFKSKKYDRYKNLFMNNDNNSSANLNNINYTNNNRVMKPNLNEKLPTHKYGKNYENIRQKYHFK